MVKTSGVRGDERGSGALPDVPPNVIPPSCEHITPAMLPLVELEAAQTVRTQEGAEVRLPDDGKSKTDAVADAGLSKYL